MIVKDEAHIIKRCLNSVKDLIDEAVIIDTGSSDNTIEVINNFLKDENLPGKVIKEPWQNFAYNRTFALKEAKKTNCDYSLMIDADEVLKFNSDFSPQKFKESLQSDFYNVPTKTSSAFYYRPTLTSNNKEFSYKAPVHEYLEAPDGCSRGEVNHKTEFFNTPIQDSARNKDPRKYEKDAKLLIEALSNETDTFLKSRYTFYAAQSYRDSNQPEKAIEYYLERGKMDFWGEECYISYYKAGQLMEKLNHPEESILNTLLKAQEHNGDRMEAIHCAVKYCRTHNRDQLGYILGKEGINKKFREDFLFAEMWIYDYAMMDEFSIAAYWAKHYQEALDCCQKLLNNPKFPKEQLPRLRENLNFAKKKLK
jgi:glycosyltransferase involved in cell wall biosynthesis